MSHKLLHSNVKNIMCDVINCNKSFKQKGGLYDHKMRFHSDIKRHKCFQNNCDKSFVTSSEIKRHIRLKHSTDKPFKRNSSLKSSQNLNNH